MLRILWLSDKTFLVLVILDIILSSLHPFVNMFLTKYSVDMLTNGGDYSKYLFVVLSLISIGFIVSILQAKVSSQTGIRGNVIGDKLFRNIFNKTMEIKFEMLLDKNILEKRKLAMQVIEQGRFNNLVMNFKQLVSNLIVLFGIIYILSNIDFWILLIVVGIVVINSFATSLRKKAERTVHIESNAVNRKIEYFWKINSDFAFGKEIRTYGMQNSLNTIYDELVLKIQKYVKKVFSLQLKSNIIFFVTNFMLNITIYLFLGYKIIVSKLISIGDFSLYLNSISSFNSSVQAIVSAYIDVSNNGQYLKDYFDFMELETIINQDPTIVYDEIPDEIKIVFENVSFTYPHQSKPVLKDINLVINKGECLSIVGENGAGKTTLIKLLLRLYEPTSGRILINGTDIRSIDYKSYIQLFSTVFQDYKLFAFKIIDNLTSLENDKINMFKISESLEKAGLLNKIKRLDKGVDTYLYNVYEEEGIELSGGESQKLAIARAIYKDAPIVILDEPTAALDPKAEYDIYTRFLSLVESKTSIFISHRLSSTKFCDRIIVLRDGEIIEIGSHLELMNKKGYYSMLFDLQAKFYIEDSKE